MNLTEQDIKVLTKNIAGVAFLNVMATLEGILEVLNERIIDCGQGTARKLTADERLMLLQQTIHDIIEKKKKELGLDDE